jgi:hypothetical protein
MYIKLVIILVYRKIINGIIVMVWDGDSWKSIDLAIFSFGILLLQDDIIGLALDMDNGAIYYV